MTSNDDPLPKGGQLRDEAADWFAQMRGPDAETHRAEFEAWLARGALHRSAYNRVAETFALGKSLKGQDFEAAAAAEPDLGVHPRKPRRAALLVCLAAVGLSVGSILFLQNPTTRGGDQVVPVASVPKASGYAGTIELTARPNSSGTFALSDGSKVRLASDSSVAVSYTSAERGLRLTRGQALFTVAHEGRPFVVRVANGSVTARGTIFEVALTRQQGVRVKLLRGVVDVDVPAAAGRPPSEHEIRSLKPGEEIRFSSTIPPASSDVQARGGEYQPKGIQEFDQASVADLIAEANRNTAVPIILTSSDIGSQRVSGTFRLENTAKLSQNLADLLGLAITINPDNIMLSRGCRATSQEKCHPPS